MSTVDVAALGDVNLDLILAHVSAPPDFGREVLAQERMVRIGGCAANLACACARLGMRTRLFGKIGRDDFGALAKAQLDRCGVLTDGLCETHAGQTGVTAAFSMGDRGFITHPGEIATLARDDLDMGLLLAARHLHVASYFLTTALRPAVPGILQQAKSAGMTTSLDTGWDPAGRWEGVDNLLRHVDLFLPNDAEAMRLAGTDDLDEAVRRLAERVPLLVVTRGPDGALVAAGGAVDRVPAFPVEVVDTTAAGDSFNAGFLWAWLQGGSVPDCLATGNACAALRVSTPGGPERMPDPGALRTFLEQHHVRLKSFPSTPASP